MTDAAAGSALGVVAYLALFAGVGLLFLFVNLLVGKLVRAADPHQEKLEVYECGEPAIGSSFVQFDLRFYVVALLFIIFDVEVAFFFTWATVFGKANHLADPDLVVITADGQLTGEATALYREMGVASPELSATAPASLAKTFSRAKAPLQLSSPRAKELAIRSGARQLALVTLIDIVVFFAILLVGFAYVWRRGDLDWVRAVSHERALERGSEPSDEPEAETVLSV